MALIYIVEDDKNIREIETYAMKNSGHKVMDFEYAKEFYKQLEVKIPDLVVLDILLPDEDGLSILKQLRQMPKTKNLPIIMVTAKASEIDKVKGLDIGADDYMTKPFGVMELISRVKALLRRTESVEDAGPIFLDTEKHAVYVDEELCELTYKEYELLRILLLNKGIVTSREIIMDRVWGTDFEGESRTLDMHIKTLRQKLKEAGTIIKTVRNVGYIVE